MHRMLPWCPLTYSRFQGDTLRIDYQFERYCSQVSFVHIRRHYQDTASFAQVPCQIVLQLHIEASKVDRRPSWYHSEFLHKTNKSRRGGFIPEPIAEHS